MRNLQMMLAASDEQYIEPFLLYSRTGEFAKRVSVRAFSKKEAFLSAMEAARPDLVLAEPAFLEAWLKTDGSRNVSWAVLGSKEEAELLGGPCLQPYQPLNLLLAAALDLAGKEQFSAGASVVGVQVIAVHSASPGAGKTSVALNLAKQLGNRGLRTFYMNLETLDSSASFRGAPNMSAAEGSGLPELLYDLKSAREKREVCRSPLSRYAFFQEKLKSVSFPPLDRPDELLQMDEEDAAALIDYVAAGGSCDIIVADTDTENHERLRALLKRADRVLWLLTDDLLHLRKTSGWMDYEESRHPEEFRALLAKSSFVVNRYGGRLENALPRPELRPSAFLSYIPSWKFLSREDVLLGSPIFQRDILALCEQLGIGETRERVPAGDAAAYSGDRR
ncbi:hypothetical protein CDO73_00105 [Saccharibacillus sp. O23]|uniref:hypothetical protein n=1 Tax=Saccharibacillus sp. O23 TaxID=2009338 RepID=UPI000B4E54EC|nr:hypothetical protein [Saccharibacillus sp. O23]OWR32957.1 hypothetical protein CDO73_00105 [Saccharibacillus sp. O23]